MSIEKFEEIDDYFDELNDNPDKITSLYNKNFVNWSGPVTPDPEKSFYSDYVAQKFLALKDPFDGLEGSNRGNYFVKGHDGTIGHLTNREEEIFAKSLLAHKVKDLGRVIDYQMPLKKVQTDDFGKVDLVSLNSETNKAYLIELKMNLIGKKEETILRAALEIETYHRVLNKSRFKEDIVEKVNEWYKKGKQPSINTDNLDIQKAVVFAVDKETGLPQELQERNAGRYQNLKMLLAKLNISVFVMDHAYPTTRMSIA